MASILRCHDYCRTGATGPRQPPLEVLALGCAGDKLAIQGQMTETEYGFIGAQIVSLAYSLTRWIEEATDAERNEQAFKWWHCQTNWA